MNIEYVYLRVRVPTDSELGEALRLSHNPNRRLMELAQFGAMVMKSGLMTIDATNQPQAIEAATPLPRKSPTRAKRTKPETAPHAAHNSVAPLSQSPLDDIPALDLEDFMKVGRTISGPLN